jgi:hypothetical protein
MTLRERIHKNRTKHVIQRARERYELELTAREVAYIEFRMFYTDCPLIQPLERMGGGCHLYAVRVKGHWLPFIFDVIDREAVTVYPWDHLEWRLEALGEVEDRFREDYANKKSHPLWSEIDGSVAPLGLWDTEWEQAS